MDFLTFENKVAIVTGAGTGIGFEICNQIVARGGSVILNDIDANLTEDAAARISAGNGRCTGVAGDSSDLTIIQQLVDTAVAKYGKLDIVVANAGITLFGDFLNYPVDSFNKVLSVNLGGSFFLAQKASKQIIQQKTKGSILFMSSVTGHQAHKNLAAYGMTKAALEMLAKTLVSELSEHDITVNTVAPGATMTERTSSDPEYARIWKSITPMGRTATPRTIADAVLFLVSDAAGHITGQSLVVDGGWTSVSPSPI